MSAARPEPCVLVAHAGRQHSHHAAAALADAGLLEGYWVGLPPRGEEIPAALTKREPDRIVGFVWAPLVRRVLERVLRGRSGGWGDFLGNRLFDTWAARRLARTPVALVIGYEVSCEKTFRAARARGIRTVLDAAAISEFDPERRWRPNLPRRLAERLMAVKRRELELAEHVLSVSAFACTSYERGRVGAERIHCVALGTDLRRFRPVLDGREGPLRILFVGTTIERKGIRELLAAFSTITGSVHRPTMRLAGPVIEVGKALRPSSPPGVQFLGPVRGSALVAEYTRADLLVLPSLEDSFGLVVAEALACGTPVVVSDHVGAKDLVVEGVNGWVVPAGSVEALASRLSWCATHVEQVRARRPACVESVKGAGWDAYGRRLVAVVEEILAEPRR